MKRYTLVMLLAVIACVLAAVPQYILGIPSSKALKQANTSKLRLAVSSLADSGLEVYYYNETEIIAGSNSPSYPNARLLGTFGNGNLYLVSKLGIGKDDAINNCGEVLLDLGTSVLFQSKLDEIQLRQKISNPFILFELKPLLFSPQTSLPIELNSNRTVIENLLTQVNPDSVLYFIQSLQDMQTRYALADNRLVVANWIKSQFLRFGVNTAELHDFQWQGTTQYDVVATITGSVYPDTYIVVGGHHDSITYTTPYVLAPGADDNASGAVAALEMARVMMATGYQPKCSIRFVTFAAEEFGLWGSKAYAQYAEAEAMNIRLMMNHDMIANNTDGDQRVLLMPYDGYLDYSDMAADITSQYTSLVPVYGNLNSGSSDSHSFWQKGYPVVYYFEYNFSPWYHSNDDITANIDPAYCAEVIRASTAVAATFSSLPNPPTNLRAWDAGNGNSLTVLWDSPNDPNVNHYKLSYTNTVTAQTVTETATNNVYVLNNLQEGISYDIYVCSVDASGNESLSVYTSGTPLQNPLTPSKFSVDPFQTSMLLSWVPNTEMDLSGYHLWRSTDANSVGELLATIPVTNEFTSYHDENLVGSQQYYYYRLSAFDNDLNESLYTEALRSRPVSMDQGILIVDETKNYSGASPFQPTDESVDSFYDTLMQGFNVTSQLDLEGVTEPLRLGDIGIYSSILWHGNDYGEVTYPSSVKDVLREYIKRGGKVLFSVYHPSKAFEQNTSYPVTFPLTSFTREVLGINSADYSSNARFKYAIPSWTSIPYQEVDSLKTTTAFNEHIFHVESITPEVGGDMVYAFDSDYADNSPQGILNGDCVAVHHEYNLGETMTLSFPLYNMQPASAKAFVNRVFGSVFNEPSPVEDLLVPTISGLSILPNHPNPFRDNTNISITSKDNHSPMTVQVYNLKGQLVSTIFSGIPSAKSSFNWDGKDNSGMQVSSGVYLLKVQQQGEVLTSKMLRMK
ncbi:MAG: M20/M25/M40 family metallo-hydrolase [Candidatus Cloacimonetes bacterium]|nr:M20/M25/M40 family metallo-hydrolase [Candidatus Cloacimonadota bacterium]